MELLRAGLVVSERGLIRAATGFFARRHQIFFRTIVLLPIEGAA
jgi:hypothetical protein